MSDHIEFDVDQQERLPNIKHSDNPSPYFPFGRPRISGMAGWLMRMGIIKNESSAKHVLGGIVIFDLIVTGFVIYFFILH